LSLGPIPIPKSDCPLEDKDPQPAGNGKPDGQSPGCRLPSAGLRLSPAV